MLRPFRTYPTVWAVTSEEINRALAELYALTEINVSPPLTLSRDGVGYHLRLDPQDLGNAPINSLTVTTLNTSELVLNVNVTQTISVVNTTQNNLSISLVGGSKIPFNVTATGAQLSGIVAPSPAVPVVLWLQNVGSQPLTILSQNAGSTAANRFITPNGENFTLSPAGQGSCCEVMIEYVPSQSLWWLVVPTPGGPVNSVVTNTPLEGGLYGGGTWFSVDSINLRVGINRSPTATPTATVGIIPNLTTDICLGLLVSSSQTAAILQSAVGSNTGILHTPVTGGTRTSLNQSSVSAAALSVTSVSDTDEVYKGVAHSNTATGNLLDLSVPGVATSCIMDTTGSLTVNSPVGGTGSISAFGGTGGSGALNVGADLNNFLQGGYAGGSGFLVVIGTGQDNAGSFKFGAENIVFSMKVNDFGHWDFIFIGVSQAITGTDTIYATDYTTGTTTPTPQVGFAGGWRDQANATHKGRGFLVACDSTAGSNPVDGASTDRECARWESDGTHGNFSVGGSNCTDGTPLTVGTGATADISIHGASYIFPTNTGSNGQVLTTNGASPGVLTWTTPSSGGTNTKPLYYTHANNTVTNTTSETTFANVSYTMPANTLTNTTCWLSISLKGTWAASNTSNNIRVRVKLGGTTVLDTGTQIFGLNTNNLGPAFWGVEGRVIPLSANTVDGRGWQTHSCLVGNTSIVPASTSACDVSNTSLAINGTLAFSVTAQPGTATVNDNITLGDVFLTIEHP